MVMIINPYNTTSSSTPGNIQIGSGTATDVVYPVQLYYNYSVSAFILSPTELSSVSGKSIYRIEYEMGNTVPACSAFLQTLSLGHYISSGFPSAVKSNLTTTGTTLITGLTNFVKVKENFTWTVPNTSTLIWQGVDFTTPFVYDGTKFLIIHWLSNDGSYTIGTASSPFCYKSTSSASNSVMYYQQDGTTPITNETTITASTGRPNIKIYWL
jgi:hypothetical protein